MSIIESLLTRSISHSHKSCGPFEIRRWKKNKKALDLFFCSVCFTIHLPHARQCYAPFSWGGWRLHEPQENRMTHLLSSEDETAALSIALRPSTGLDIPKTHSSRMRVNHTGACGQGRGWANYSIWPTTLDPMILIVLIIVFSALYFRCLPKDGALQKHWALFRCFWHSFVFSYTFFQTFKHHINAAFL